MMLFQRDGGRFRDCEDALGPNGHEIVWYVRAALKMEVASMLYVGGGESYISVMERDGRGFRWLG